MRVSVTVHRLSPPLVEVTVTPSLASRLLAAITGGLLGRRSRCEMSRTMFPDGGGSWIWCTDKRVVDDEVHAAIVDSITEYKIQFQSWWARYDAWLKQHERICAEHDDTVN